MVSGLIFPIGKGGVWCYLVGDLDFVLNGAGRDANLGSGVFGEGRGNDFLDHILVTSKRPALSCGLCFLIFRLVNLLTPLQVFGPKKAYPSGPEKRGDDV